MYVYLCIQYINYNILIHIHSLYTYLCIGNNSDHIYCVDFGLSKRYRDPDDNNTHIQYYTGHINNDNIIIYLLYIYTYYLNI